MTNGLRKVVDDLNAIRISLNFMKVTHSQYYENHHSTPKKHEQARNEEVGAAHKHRNVYGGYHKSFEG